MDIEEVKEDIKLGQIWKFKTADEEFIGKVESFGSSGIKIIKQDSNTVKRVQYNLIISYDFISETENTDGVSSSKDCSSERKNITLIECTKSEKKKLSVIDTRTSPENVQKVIDYLKYNPNELSNIEISFNSVFKLINSKLSDTNKKETSKIKSKLIEARKNHEDDFNHTRIKQIFAQLDNLSKATNPCAYALKGALFFEYGKTESVEFFKSSNEYKLIFYSILKMLGEIDELYKYAVLFINEDSSDKIIISWLLNYAIAHNRNDLISFLMNKDKDDTLCILLNFYKNSDVILQLPNLRLIEDEKNLVFLKEKFSNEEISMGIIDSIINEHITNDKQKSAAENNNDQEVGYKIGFITYYNQERLFGSIGEVFFHLRQVSDENLQRLLLKTGFVIGRKLEVKYRLGRNREGRICADDITLIRQIGFEDTKYEKVVGKIIEYDIFSEKGVIVSDGKSCKITGTNIADPVLAKILDYKFEKFPINVVFDLRNASGKLTATNIKLSPEYSKDKMQVLLQRKIITKNDINQHDNFSRQIYSDEGYYTFEYVPLIPIELHENSESGVKVINSLASSYDNYYFEIARSAEQYEQNFDKVIKNYKLAIENKQNLSSAVLNLALYYSRFDMKSEAINLLNGYKDELDYSRYLNTKIAVLTKKIDKTYSEELLEALDEMIKLTKTTEKQILLRITKARSLYFLECYKEAEELCLFLETKQLASFQQKNVYVILCNIYLKEKTISKAIEYAKKIIQIAPEDPFALSVINNPEVEIFDDITADLLDYNMGEAGVSSYILDKVEHLNLQTQLRKSDKVDKGNNFTGTDEEAEKIIGGIFRNQQTGGNFNQLADNRFTIALLIRQIIDKSLESKQIIKEKRFTENNYLENIAFGAMYYGDSRLITTDIPKNLDTARFCYQESAKIFKDAERIHPCWYSSTLSYFMSFVNSDLEAIKKLQISKFRETDPAFEEIFKDIMNSQIQDISLFVIGLLEYFEFDEKNRQKILRIVFNSRNADKIKSKFTELFKIEFDNNYIRFFNKCLAQYSLYRQQFIKEIDNTITNMFSLNAFSQYSEQLKESVFIKFLNSTDQLIIEKLQDIFNKVRKYNEAPDFDYKDEKLREVEDKRQAFADFIQTNTTRFGYEIIAKRIDTLYAKLVKESQSLYGNYVPDIDIRLVDDSVNIISNANKVSFIVGITNKKNVQIADNAIITVSSDKAEKITSDELAKEILKGDGIQSEKIYEFKLTEKILREKILPVHVSISYEYSKNMTDRATNMVHQDLSIPLEKIVFEAIDNKFDTYRDGSEVKDDKMFFGRDHDIEQIIKEVCDINGKIHAGKSLALYGQTRTGKSSLLYHVAKKLREINLEKNIIINVGSIGVEDLSKTLYEFLYTVLDALEAELKKNHKNLYDELLEHGIDVSPDLLPEDDNSQLKFNKMFKDFCRYVENTHNVIVMIDEFTYVYDWIRQNIMTDRFMKFWKAFIQNNGIYAIIIGQDHMMQFVNDPRFTNDFGSTVKKKVTYLSEKDAKALMEEPIMYSHNGTLVSRYKEGALNRLYELTSGSAFLIMKLCAGIVDYINNEIHSPYITQAYINDYIKKNITTFDEADYFEPQYSDKSSLNSLEIVNKNKEILKRIAKESARKDWAPYDRVVLNEDDKNIIKNLEERDVVIVEEEQKCKIKVALYKEWLLAKYGD